MAPLIIGTRDSELALWQAKTVQKKLQENGISSELHPVKSSGDLNLDIPLYEMGITGIFTKSLDVALINGDIDLAVHSMKDVPTQLPKSIVQAAVLERANPYDILVHKGLNFLKQSNGHIATGSLRRQAQWLNKYPQHQVSNLRGNVNTRLQKLKDSTWNAAIFAAAGLERINLTPENSKILKWMIPAPAQGAMLAVTREEKQEVLKAMKPLNDNNTMICVHVERSFLRKLEGGCSAPIGALAMIENGVLTLDAGLFSLDGKQRFQIKKSVPVTKYKYFGEKCAEHVLKQGGDDLMAELKNML